MVLDPFVTELRDAVVEDGKKFPAALSLGQLLPAEIGFGTVAESDPNH
jgi:hypothetical protein